MLNTVDVQSIEAIKFMTFLLIILYAAGEFLVVCIN